MLSEIHNSYPTLTEAERRVADAVLRAPREVLGMSVQTLAGEAGAAPSAVVRFCRTVGCRGFSDFKLRLAGEMSERREPVLPAIREGDSVPDVFGKVFHSGIRALEDTLSMLDPAAIEEITELFLRAKRVVFFGVGTSSVIATDAHYRFAQMGVAASSCTDILFMNVTALHLEKGDVAVGVSHSGETRATVDALRRARASGAETVAVTSFANSTLARESNHAVVAFSDEQNYPVEAVSARVAHICIIDAFMMAIAVRRYRALPGYLAGRNEILRDIRYTSRRER